MNKIEELFVEYTRQQPVRIEELPLLTLSQRKTIYKMFVLNKTQSDHSS